MTDRSLNSVNTTAPVRHGNAHHTVNTMLRTKTGPLVLGALVSALLGGLYACGGPQSSSGTTVREGTGITDYYTIRSNEDGDIVGRDLVPMESPREAIRRDDYFAIKLEHIFVGDIFGADRREFSNLAIITEIGGILPQGVDCDLVPEEDLDFTLSDEPEDNIPGASRCAFKSVVQNNPVFDGAHATFDSTFISPPFRTQLQPLQLRFMMAELRDVTLAQRIVDWASNLFSRAVPGSDLLGWQQEIVNVGFSAVNYLLAHAARPSYIFELSTDFVPIESVSDSGTPQALLMASDFIVVGLPSSGPDSALLAQDALMLESGRLYYAATGEEYRDSAYIIYKVVRFSRYPGALPVNIPDLIREMRGADDLDAMQDEVEDLLDDLQTARIVNETEGTMLRQMVDWLVETAPLIDAVGDDEFADPPIFAAELPADLAAGLAALDELEELADQIEYLEERLYGNFAESPGILQDECVALRRLTQDAADAYEPAYEDVIEAFEALQLRRVRLRDDPSQADVYDLLFAIEPSVQSAIEDLPEVLPEPECPGLRQAWE